MPWEGRHPGVHHGRIPPVQGDIYGMTVSVRQGRAAADPYGVALLITAGKRSAPADSPHTIPTP